MKTPSRVYFIAVQQADDLAAVEAKLARLLKVSRLLDCISRQDKVAVKLHFGEEANTGFVRPEYARLIVDELKRRGAAVFLSDTNTLYHGRRMNSTEHLKLAREHGFTPEVTGTAVVIPDDTKKENVSRVVIKQRYVQEAKVARLFLEAAAIVSVAHFKGHIVAGFGGALKNIGMGCASREGKLEQHCDVSPFVILKKCVGCGACAEVCPAGAITLKSEKAYVDGKKCLGCASCIAACPYGAIDVRWGQGVQTIQEKMAEYAWAVLKEKRRKSVFFNFALKITKECDCLAKDDPRIAPDIGILACVDPVSVDKASFDLVNQVCGKDIFREAHPDVDGLKQLRHAAQLGLGNLDYELIKL